MKFLSILAGLLFGVWPLLMSRSGQGGNVNAALFAGLNCLVLLPFAYTEGLRPYNTLNSAYVLGAVLFGAVGLKAFGIVLSDTPRGQLGWMMITMVIIQMMVPALYQAFTTSDFSARKLVGLLLAMIAVWLLN